MPGETDLPGQIQPPVGHELGVLGRRHRIFAEDLAAAEDDLSAAVRGASFLVLGGAGSIGQAVVRELFRRRPRALHVVDLSENNLAELVRDLRSSHGYLDDGDFRTLALDCGAAEYQSFVETVPAHDHVLDFSAMKHVRSERDPFTLMRMVRTNVLDTESTLGLAIGRGVGGYFAVSSDKAVNPTNAMGASKRIMELCLARAGESLRVSSSRFANVAFSDGSLLHSFVRRLEKRQPLAGPDDVRRYFITAGEAASLSLMACLLGANRECFVPATPRGLEPTGFREIAEAFLEQRGYAPHPCASEEEARERVEELAAEGRWPLYFTPSDTTGEKPLEEFQRRDEEIDRERFGEIGVIRWPVLADEAALDAFLDSVRELRRGGRWTRRQILDAMETLLPEFRHCETGRFLDAKM